MAVDDTTTSTDLAEEAVDTSVNSDDSSNTDDDVDLEDIEVDLSDIDSDEDDEQQDEADEAEAVDESEDDTAEDEPSEDNEETPQDAELSDEQREAQHRREMYERRQQEKEARIQRVQEAQAEYVNEAAENADPLEHAVRQIQVDQYNTKVEAVTNKLTNGYERALTDFPVLKTSDPVVQAEIDATIDAFQAQHVTIDGFGNAVDVSGDLYATLQAKADSIEKLTGIRAKRQEQSKTKEKSKTLTAPRRAPQQPKVDPDLAAFDEEAGL